MNILNGGLEIHNLGNKEIVLDDEFADVLGIKRRVHTIKYVDT